MLLGLNIAAALAGPPGEPVRARPGPAHRPGLALPNIHAETPVIIVCRSLDRSLERLSELYKKLGAERQAYPIGALEELGLSDNDIDFSAPILLAIATPEFDRRPVVIFRPVDDSRWRPPPPPPGGAPARAIFRVQRASGRTLYVGRRDDWVYAGSVPRDIRRLMRPSERPLQAALDTTEKELLHRSDLFVRAWVPAWQSKLAQLLVLGRSAIAIAGTAANGDEASRFQTASVNWMLDGASVLIRDLRSTSLALEASPRGIRLTHYHTFENGSTASEYLSKTEHADIRPWVGMPRRSFLVAFASNWNNPRDGDLMISLIESIFRDTATTGPAPAGEAALRESYAGFCKQLRATTSVLDMTGDGHMETVGVYHVRDADTAMRQMDELSRRSTLLLSEISPGLAIPAPYERSKIDGVEVLQASYAKSRSSAHPVSCDFVTMFGTDAVGQVARAGDHLLVSSLSNEPARIAAACRAARDGDTGFAGEPRVAALLRELPERPHFVAIANLNRGARFLPFMVTRAQQGGAAPPSRVMVSNADVPAPPAPPAPPVTPPECLDGGDPVAGWAVVAGPTWVRGEAFISGDDLARAIPLLVQLGRELRGSAEAEPPAKSRVVVRVRRNQ